MARGHALKRRYGRADSSTTEFKHLLLGQWFRFAEDEEWQRPWVKVNHSRYVSALAPSAGPKYQHTARANDRVRHAEAYPTHAFPGAGR